MKFTVIPKGRYCPLSLPNRVVKGKGIYKPDPIEKNSRDEPSSQMGGRIETIGTSSKVEPIRDVEKISGLLSSIHIGDRTKGRKKKIAI